MKKLIFLVGMMGTGKSTIGKLLSSKLQLGFIDSDHQIEKINRLALKENLKHIVCTEKDFVKLVEFKRHLKVDISAIIMNHQLSEEIERDILARLV